MKLKTGYNSTYKKLAVQWINEALYFVSSSVVADNLRLQNRQLLIAAKRCSAILNPLQNNENHLARVFRRTTRVYIIRRSLTATES